VRGSRSWIDIDAGLLHTCGVTTTNEAFCWGFNDQGQLGIGTKGFSQTRVVPKLVLGGKSFKAVALGGEFSCGLTTAGAAWCWGGNTGGQLGDGTTTERLTPAAVKGNKKWDLIAAGYDQACGVASNGTAWCWGDNLWGELGNGTRNNISAEPGRVAAPIGR
jgi:alpha-tubulin suppressor-like RCC1 family protein